MIDLHVHSSVSDGSYTPTELITYAKERTISVLALTDHDTLDGLDEAASAAASAGITFIRGVELNIEWPTGEFHLLGLGLRSIDPSLVTITKELQTGRIERNAQMLTQMHSDGYDVSFEELCQDISSVCIGRPHIAEYLVRKGIVKTRQKAFDQFLAKGRPYFIGRQCANLDTSIDAILKSGGVPILAHPLSLYQSWGKLPDVLKGLRERGVVGIEAWHPGAREVECKRLEELGQSLGFVITAGSDFHGESVRNDRKIGYTAGKQKIKDSYWTEQLQPALESRLTETK